MSKAPSTITRKLPPRVYAVMAMTTFSTFGVLVTSYQLLFPGPFA
jgi:hypothetical protein